MSVLQIVLVNSDKLGVVNVLNVFLKFFYIG